jgi:hypothetical protein
MRITNALVVIFGVAGFGCHLYAQAPARLSQLAGCGDDQTKFKVSRGEVRDHLETPEPGKATVYIVEVLNLADRGRIARPVILQGLDGKWLGATQGFTYLEATIAPGEHHLCSRWQSDQTAYSDQVSLYNFEALAGRRYFFRTQVVMQSKEDTPFIDLEPVSEDEGQFLMSQAARSVSKPKQ